MFGRTVEIDGLKIHVSCTPSTPLWQILLDAAKQVKAWHEERDFDVHGKSIAFRHNIEISRS